MFLPGTSQAGTGLLALSRSHRKRNKVTAKSTFGRKLAQALLCFVFFVSCAIFFFFISFIFLIIISNILYFSFFLNFL
jgi:hypothetical protein